ncbi:hypothetical protein EHQ68_09640 [Leptospira congkakensis]|uniref:Uncharacterized protein n=1 Tax=Leptospira congkakensis TaxID=2484932 RepID=A0A4Z1A8B5_9LEPT|nr:hypothetical protein [Leptospira congkakensis]TGL86017.1 hypothetical protein EHQ69_18235 [Leptospira congkakensis]TGL88891.1 hypothetical protein EHQ68_09640 [Leptospira congkakensis]TGL93393.1 hypothetical protein EHQ70_17805 [Leptospira congkakensis]
MVFVKLQMRDLLFSPWKAPSLDAQEQTLENQKEIQKKVLAQLGSRLESVELLLSNEKLEETKILFRFLAFDLVNFQLLRTNQKEIPYSGDLSGFTIPETDRKLKPFRFLETLDRLSHFTEKEMDEILSLAVDTYDYLLYESTKDFKARFQTTLDQFRFIRLLRLLILSAVLFFSIFGYAYNQYKYPVMRDQSIKLYTFIGRDKPETSESLSVSKPVLKKDIGNWVEYEWTLPESMSKFGGLRIDPLEQRGIRFVLDQISILDSKGKEIYSKKIVMSSSLLPEDYQDFLQIIDIKTAGKQSPGEMVEMITTGSNPQIQLVFPTLNDAKTIKLKMKYIEAHKVKKK